MNILSKGEAGNVFVSLVARFGQYTLPRPGLTLVVTLCKEGAAAFAAIAGTVTEITTPSGVGVYRINLTAADTGTEGRAILKISNAAMDDVFVDLFVTKMVKDAKLARAGVVGTSVETGGVVSFKDDDDSTELVSVSYPGDPGDRTAVFA